MHKQHFIDGTLNKIRRYQEIQYSYFSKYIQGKVLDIGASEGYFGTLDKNWNYAGFDLLPDSDHIKTFDIDKDEINENYNSVILNHTLEHTKHPYKALEKIYNCLSINGYLFLAVPEARSRWSWELEGHLYLFNKTTLTKIVESIGYIVVESFEVCFRDDKNELWMLCQKI